MAAGKVVDMKEDSRAPRCTSVGHKWRNQSALRGGCAAIFVGVLLASALPSSSSVARADDVPYDTTAYYPTLYRQWGFGSTERDQIWATDPYQVISNGVDLEVNPRYGNNVRIIEIASNGNTGVQIVTRRHCTATMSEPLVAGGKEVGGNESPNKCPGNQKTRYSTGRLTSSVSTAFGGNFLFVARLKADSVSPNGVRAAVWMNTANFEINPPSSGHNRGYCDSNPPGTDYAEMDVLEWYGGDLKDKPTMTNHVSCDPNGPKPSRRAATYLSSSGWAGSWHSLSVISDGDRIRNYTNLNYSDDAALLKIAPIGNQFGYSTSNWTGGDAPTLDQWNATMKTGANFQLIISATVLPTEIKPVGGLVAKGVDNNAPFPSTALTVDYARVYIH